MNKINHEEEYLKEAKEIALRLNTSPDYTMKVQNEKTPKNIFESKISQF